MKSRNMPPTPSVCSPPWYPVVRSRDSAGSSDRCASTPPTDRKSTRLNSSHRTISYAVFCLKKKIKTTITKLFHLRSFNNSRFLPPHIIPIRHLHVIFSPLLSVIQPTPPPAYSSSIDLTTSH